MLSPLSCTRSIDPIIELDVCLFGLDYVISGTDPNSAIPGTVKKVASDIAASASVSAGVGGRSNVTINKATASTMTVKATMMLLITIKQLASLLGRRFGRLSFKGHLPTPTAAAGSSSRCWRMIVSTSCAVKMLRVHNDKVKMTAS
jgi:F420-0:gamma-glutamyl ligase-like protein